MARRHGWQLPANSFQIAAITAFCLLSIAFYIFFAPFIGNDVYEYVALAVYSVLVFFVIILYVRCTAIDPADPGILISDEGSIFRSKRDKVSLEEPSNVGLKTEEHSERQESTACSEVGCFVCNLMVKEDCRNDDNFIQQQESNEEALFCTICKTEVRKFSKHCKSCDKCVDGFDHHCRWLNNCIGRKNYITFLFLMATSIAWLAVECGVGIAIFVRCFMHNSTIKLQIHDRLGDGVSVIPLAIIVGICTVFAFIALIPVGELFFFHIILIRKGITTYEYMVAMRTESEPRGPSVNEDPHSPLTSPMSSVVTAISGNSLGLQHRGAWCTPPRIFMDNQDEIVPHFDQGHAPSTVDPDSINPPEIGKRQPKKQVRINPWKLVKLDSGEASKAAAKARASSSVLKPISSRPNYDHHDQISLGNTSGRSSTHHTSTQPGTLKSSPYQSPYPPSSGSREEDPETLRSTFSTPPHDTGNQYNPMYQTLSNQSSLTVRSTDVDNNSRLRSSNSRSSVYWDQEAGRFVSSENTSGSTTTSRAGPHQTEMLYPGNSIFFGGPVLSGGKQRRGDEQLPVFAPRDSGAP